MSVRVYSRLFLLTTVGFNPGKICNRSIIGIHFRNLNEKKPLLTAKYVKAENNPVNKSAISMFLPVLSIWTYKYNTKNDPIVSFFTLPYDKLTMYRLHKTANATFSIKMTAFNYTPRGQSLKTRKGCFP